MNRLPSPTKRRFRSGGHLRNSAPSGERTATAVPLASQGRPAPLSQPKRATESRRTRSELAVFRALIHQRVRHSPRRVEVQGEPVLSWRLFPREGIALGVSSVMPRRTRPLSSTPKGFWKDAARLPPRGKLAERRVCSSRRPEGRRVRAPSDPEGKRGRSRKDVRSFCRQTPLTAEPSCGMARQLTAVYQR